MILQQIQFVENKRYDWFWLAASDEVFLFIHDGQDHAKPEILTSSGRTFATSTHLAWYRYTNEQALQVNAEFSRVAPIPPAHLVQLTQLTGIAKITSKTLCDTRNYLLLDSQITSFLVTEIEQQHATFTIQRTFNIFIIIYNFGTIIYFCKTELFIKLLTFTITTWSVKFYLQAVHLLSEVGSENTLYLLKAFKGRKHLS